MHAYNAATVTRCISSSQLFRKSNTPCCMSGTTSAMLRMAYILITPRCRARSGYIGYARSVQRVSCTNTKCVLLAELEGNLVGGHTVPAIKCVTATPWQPASQLSQQSGTSPGMRGHQLMSLQGLPKWCGGGTTGEAAGSSKSMNAQLLARMLVDGTLAHAPHKLVSHVAILR